MKLTKGHSKSSLKMSLQLLVIWVLRVLRLLRVLVLKIHWNYWNQTAIYLSWTVFVNRKRYASSVIPTLQRMVNCNKLENRKLLRSFRAWSFFPLLPVNYVSCFWLLSLWNCILWLDCHCHKFLRFSLGNLVIYNMISKYQSNTSCLVIQNP